MSKDITLALLAKIAQTRGELAREDKTNWSYNRGKLDGLMFALERTLDTDREVEILTKYYSGILRRNAHQLDIDTRVQFKKLISQAIYEYERSA